MRLKTAQRLEARRLREGTGWSLTRIARELGVAKSTVSVWVRDVAVPRSGPLRPAEALAVRPLPIWTSGRTRRCGRCGRTLPIEFFNRLRDGHQWWCRSCFKAYFRDRGDVHRAQSERSKQMRVRRAQAHVLAYLMTRPCRDCGIADPIVLEFDHVAEKRHGLSVMVARGVRPDDIGAELTACEVVCVNCHRRRTALRGGWLRANAAWRDLVAASATPTMRNMGHVLEVLGRSGCVDCASHDLVTLDFDHIGIKQAAVMQLAHAGCGLDKLQREIALCEVRCGNCHRRRTAARAGTYRHVASIVDGRL